MVNSKGRRIYKLSKNARDSALQRQRDLAEKKYKALEEMWPNGKWYPEEVAPRNPKNINLLREVKKISTR
jgi:hypothetical protein